MTLTIITVAEVIGTLSGQHRVVITTTCKGPEVAALKTWVPQTSWHHLYSAWLIHKENKHNTGGPSSPENLVFALMLRSMTTSEITSYTYVHVSHHNILLCAPQTWLYVQYRWILSPQTSTHTSYILKQVQPHTQVLCACVHLCVCTCECECVCMRDRERENVCVSVSHYYWVHTGHTSWLLWLKTLTKSFYDVRL